MFYLDTSVITAYYCPEPLSATVEKIITRSQEPAISQLTALELVSALSRKIRDKELSSADGNKIVSHFHTHIEQHLFKWVTIELLHYQTAKGWIAQFTTPLRTLYALHLAVAASNNLTLVTADTHLAAAARHFGVSTKLIINKQRRKPLSS